jgi:mono/diheme cytochrome c family protein
MADRAVDGDSFEETGVSRSIAHLAAAGGLALLLAGPALAQQSDGAAPSEAGARLYEVRCALCHGENGRGVSSAFPSLSGNDRLDDLTSIVTVLRQGRNGMPPFSDLSAEQIALLATHVRSAWGNDFGAVAADEVAALPDVPASAATLASIWDGVFSGAQAQRGGALYEGPCGWCHGRRLNGAPDDPDMRSTPALARAPFLRRWEGRSLATLYEYIRATMPENSPGSLSEQEYVDLIAYMLEVSGAEAGEDELQPDAPSLAQVRIEQPR